MFKKLLMIISMVAFTCLPVVSYGDDADKVAHFIRDILGGDSFEQKLLRDHPGGDLEWGGHVLEVGEEKFACLVYSEFTQQGKEPLYHFYEVTVRYLPPAELFQDISNN